MMWIEAATKSFHLQNQIKESAWHKEKDMDPLGKEKGQK
jgi:hypothetical protein